MPSVRRLSLVLALASGAALLPGAAAAQVEGGGTHLGVLVGFEDGPGAGGLALRVEGELPLLAVARGVALSCVVSAGYARWGRDAGFFADRGSGAGILKLGPALRLSFLPAPAIRPYVDAGLGLHYATAVDRGGAAASDVNVHLRLAGGLLFQVAPGLAVGAEIDVLPYYGRLNDTTTALLFETSVRLR